ncbi:TIGR04255 family protein [Seohaeicola nanhaiensis]|uniref:TIGR04255 family protein n=1 Tax=Seohaeicola nanhaiensis TaxID=1387282 RepID=A0ABV9KHN7_9RHOB
MSERRLPTILEREPLVDAVFEVRLGGNPHLADLLPGILFNQLGPRPTLERLATADIPEPIRVSEPNLAFAPVIRLHWREFAISFGSRNVVIACKLPYPKWPRFKDAILDIVDKVSQVGISGPIERYSLKYVNLIQAPTVAEQIQKINLAIRVGDVDVKDDHVSVQVHRTEGETLHIMSVVTGAKGKMADGKLVSGAVVDIDSIRPIQFPDFRTFAENLGEAVETLRTENKIKFFSCLTEATVDEMGPKYD